MKCAHLQRADYKIAVPSGNTIIEHVPWLCEWPDQNPDRFVDAPWWLTNLVNGGGMAITPALACAKCPAFKARPI